jgi:S-adenosylmethionine:tRNA ribosyltransferase-isomerase
MNAATHPRQGPHGAKLLVIDETGVLAHYHAGDLPKLLHRDDLVVANDAATIPASLHGTHLPTGLPIEIRLAGRRSLAPRDVDRFTAVVFGAGDYRTATEHRPEPPQLHRGDDLTLGPLRATVIELLGHRRLVELRLNASAEEIWEGIARHGRPIQYAYVPEPLAIWDTWTSIASTPVAFEAPSAGFVLDWATLRAIRSRGAQFATLTHAAGISSTGDIALDALLPLDEPYVIPRTTASLIDQTKHRGGRIVAVGTTVVRALEHAARRSARPSLVAGSRSWVAPGKGIATQRITSKSNLRIVDAIVSGLHESGSSHYELLRAFQSDRALAQMTEQADGSDYRAHEFGDTVFIARAAASRSRKRRVCFVCQSLGSTRPTTLNSQGTRAMAGSGSDTRR